MGVNGRYYMLAYNHLRNTLPALSVREVKTITEIVHYKIVFALLIQNKIQEAVEQQQRHIAYWKHPITPIDMPFMHYAWLSHQYVRRS